MLHVTIDGTTFAVSVGPQLDGRLLVTVDGEPLEIALPHERDVAWLDDLIIAGRPYRLHADRELRWLLAPDGRHAVEVRADDALEARPASRDGRVMAPIPGLVTRVLVELGDPVVAGQPLLVLEAMKMENEICAPRAGAVAQLHVAPGSSVRLRELLAEIA